MSQKSQITEVINGVLRNAGLDREPRAARVVEQVADALSSALDERVERVINLAASEGINEGTARQAFVDAGLADVPTPVAEETTSDDGNRLSKIEETLARLVRAAESRGLRI